MCYINRHKDDFEEMDLTEFDEETTYDRFEEVEELEDFKVSNFAHSRLSMTKLDQSKNRNF